MALFQVLDLLMFYLLDPGHAPSKEARPGRLFDCIDSDDSSISLSGLGCTKSDIT